MNTQVNTQATIDPRLQACSGGACFEISELEIAAEMAVVGEPGFFDQRDTEMAPEDFERVYQWFLS